MAQPFGTKSCNHNINMKKKIGLKGSSFVKFCFLVVALAVSTQVQSQYYSLLPSPLCWSVSPGVDSSIISVRFYIAGNNSTTPIGTTGYWDLYGNSVTVASGTLTSGFCQGDTLIVAPVLPPDCPVTRDLDHFDITTGTTTFAANTYHGVAISVVTGTAMVTINSKTHTYPAGYSNFFNSPHQCEFLKDAIQIQVTSGRVLVSTIQ